MNFDPTIGLGSIITIIVLVGSGIGTWYAFKAEFREGARRLAAIEERQGGLEADLSAHKLHMSETYVRRDDLEKLEDRLGKMFDGLIAGVGKRMDIVEHQLRNLDTRIISFLTLKGRERE